MYCYLVPARGSLKVATSRCTIFVSTQKIWLREDECAWEKLFDINYSIRLWFFFKCTPPGLVHLILICSVNSLICLLVQNMHVIVYILYTYIAYVHIYSIEQTCSPSVSLYLYSHSLITSVLKQKSINNVYQ